MNDNMSIFLQSTIVDVVPELAVRRVHSEKNRKVYKSEEDIPVKFTLGNIDENCMWDAPEYKIDGLSYSWDELHHMYYSDEPQEYEFYRVYNEKEEFFEVFKIIKKIISQGIKVFIHYVIDENSIDEQIIRLRYNGFINGIYGVVFHCTDDIRKSFRFIEFLELIEKSDFSFNIYMDNNCIIK